MADTNNDAKTIDDSLDSTEEAIRKAEKTAEILTDEQITAALEEGNRIRQACYKYNSPAPVSKQVYR